MIFFFLLNKWISSILMNRLCWLAKLTGLMSPARHSKFLDRSSAECSEDAKNAIRDGQRIQCQATLRVPYGVRKL